MKQIEFDDFSKLLSTVADYYGKQMKPGAIRLYWNALERVDFETVKGLMNEHVKTSRFMPTISELLDTLKVLDGRPEPEEAWAMVARSINDEGMTLVWTAEMSHAYGVARHLSNDRIAARMAFKEAYTNAVAEARRQGVAASWSVSLGHDIAGREGPLLDAVKRGRLPAGHVIGLLPVTSVNPEILRLVEKVA